MAAKETDSGRARAWQISDHFDGRRFINPTLPVDHRPGFRTLFRMLRTPRSPWPRFVENEGVPQLDARLGRGDVAITFVNHATFLIQFDGFTILTDPVWSERASMVSCAGPRRVRKPGVAFEDLPRIDLILLSHNHYDHCDAATLRRLHGKFSPAIAVAAGDGRLARRFGFADAHELDWWDQITVGGLKITFAPTQHFSARGLHDRQRSLWGSYMIEGRGRRTYFGGDAGYSTHFAAIRARLGAPDIAMLGIGAYEPRWFMAPVHMNPAEAVRAHRDLGARHSIGMHFGTFQLTPEPIDQPKIDLAAALIESGVSGQDFVTLHEGKTRIYRSE